MSIPKILCFCILTTPSLATAEYNVSKLSEAFGGYIAATDMLVRTQNSPKCGYIIKDKHYSVESVINEGRHVLKKDDIQKVENLLQNGFLDSNIKIFDGFFKAGRSDGLDNKTLCGMWVNNLAIRYDVMKKKWLLAKQKYSK